MSRDWSKVKEICEKATEGPWEDFKPKASNGFVQVKQDDLMVNTCYGLNANNDAELIALARTALPEAIAEIEQLRQELEVQNKIRSEAMGDIQQLRQEKAELVEALKKAKDIIDEVQSNDGALEIHGWHLNGDPVSYEALILDNIPEDDVAEIECILAKLEGGEPNAKP